MSKINKPEISKSQYVKGKQCPKALWFFRHRKDLAPEIDEGTQAIFDQGHEVGLLAQEYFKKGTEIIAEYWDIEGAIIKTDKVIEEGEKIIFEACACSEDGLYSKIDVLKKVRGKDEWDLIEVKSSTSVKDYHLDDMASQRYAFEGAGYKIRKSILMHINNQYSRKGELDLNEFFTLEDCTKDVLAAMSEVEVRLDDLKKFLRKKKEPVADIGTRCSKPHGCDYMEHCWAHVPEFSVYDITSGKKLQSLLDQDILDAKDIPDDFKLGEKKLMDLVCYKENKVMENKDELQEWVKDLEYPLYFLDYETAASAIPQFDDMRPYSQVPFQFSLHIQKEKGGELTHLEYLHTEASDPRPNFAKALVEACADSGSIIVYNQPFEAGVNNKLGEVLPEYASALHAINNRMVDLIIPFRARMLYHPDQQCSASIKDVLPAFCPEFSYENLDISDGLAASRQGQAFIENKMPEEDREESIKALKEYCGQDTLAMVKLLEVIFRIIG